jgi:hypothetical protein
MAIRAEWRSLLGRVSRRKAWRQAAVEWTPHNDGSSAMAWLRSRNPHVTFVVGALMGSLLIGTSAWVMGGHTLNVPSFRETQASTAPRYAPLNLAERSPPAAVLSETDPVVARQDQTAHVVADEETVELKIGQRTRLAAHIDEADALKPETLALINGLPEGVQLSDGIRINTQLWMLRPDLLSTVEVEAARGPVGRYPVTLELRTPEGQIVSSAQTMLVIVAAVEDNAAAAQSERAVADERKDNGTRPSPKDQQPAVPIAVTPAPGKPDTMRAARTRIETPRQVKTQTQSRVKTIVTRPEPIISPKPVQKARPVRPDATASVPPVVAQGPQSQQKLVWPGDNPRAVYTQTPPFFLGGAVPNTAPQSQPAPVQNENWHRRVFETPGQ